MENKTNELPAEIRGWNWGAFLLNWIWGIGNGVYIALLCLLPFVNIVMVFVLGAKGNKWAWEKGNWKSVEHFKRVQRLWTIWGLAIYGALIALFVGIFFFTMSSIKNSEIVKLSLSSLQSKPEIVERLGTPLEITGFPTGAVKTKNDKGIGIVEIGIKGPKTKANMNVIGYLKDKQWKIALLTVDFSDTDEFGKFVDLAIEDPKAYEEFFKIFTDFGYEFTEEE